MSLKASSGIVKQNTKRTIVETYGDIDASTTKNSDRVTFACIVIGDKLEDPDSPEH